LILITQVLFPAFLAAAPLEGGYKLAPSPSASSSERAAAYQEARSLVLSAAARYERTPYRFAGTDRNGIDCSGLIYVSFRDGLGVEIPRTSASLYSWAEKIPIEAAEPGDLLFFVTGGAGISHVAIFTGGRRFIHAASEGPSTGVIYSTLDESYWSRTFASAGRVFPESGALPTGTPTPPKASPPPRKEREYDPNANFIMGIGAAPTWNTYFPSGEVLRGAAGFVSLGTDFKLFNATMLLSLEARPEWDKALDVFRLPITLSIGTEKFSIFGGIAVNFGESFSLGDRPYKEGNIFGAAGFNLAPFVLSFGDVKFAPYAELAWQSFVNDNAPDKNIGADIAAAIRFSTGLKFYWKI